MDGKTLSYWGLGAAALVILPIIPAYLIYIKEILAVLTLIIGIFAMKKNDRHGGIIVLILGICLVIQAFMMDVFAFLFR